MAELQRGLQRCGGFAVLYPCRLKVVAAWPSQSLTSHVV